MNLPDRKNLIGPLLVLALFIAVVATLRYAQEFFLSLVLAGLLSFLLSPLVRRLERWRIGAWARYLARRLWLSYCSAG